MTGVYQFDIYLKFISGKKEKWVETWYKMWEK